MKPRTSSLARAAVLAGAPLLATCASSSTDEDTASTSPSPAPSTTPSDPFALPPLRSGPVTDRATLAGRVPGGTILLRSGVRWLASADGIEEEFSRQPLALAIAVPPTAAARAASSPAVLVGADERAVYRFDDPLGPGTVLHRSTRGRITALGSVPGAVHVMPEDVYVDVGTGTVSPTTNAAPVPPRSVLFLDADRGLSSFVGVRGAFVTRDGGKTWAALDGAAREHARETQDGMELSTELLHQVFEVDAEVPLDVRWVLDTKTDPLAAAAWGVPLASGGAVVAHGRHLARVDLSTGEVLEMTETPEPCSVAHTADGPVAICLGSESKATAHAVREHPLALWRPTPAGFGRPITAPSGALATQGRCEVKGSHGAICVRQPDGTWATVEADFPRRDGTGIASSAEGDTWRMESVDREGRRSLLAQAPPGRFVYAVSEDEEGAAWVLAGQGGSLGAHGPRVDDGKWFVGELKGTAIAWRDLGGGGGCGLRGRATICAVEDGVEVRSGSGSPQRVETRTTGGIEVLPLGFRSRGTTHLGFEQGELPWPIDEDHEAHFDGTLVCEGLGPTTKLPPLARDDEPEHDGRLGSHPLERLRGRLDVTGALRGMWVRKGAEVLVRFVDAFAPGTGVRELRFPLATSVKASPARVETVARHGDAAVAFVATNAWTFAIPSSGGTSKIARTALRPSHAWIGADGSILTRRSRTMFQHWLPAARASTQVELGDVSVLGVDEDGFSFVAPSRGSAAKGRVAAGRPEGSLHVTELERADHLGVVSLLRGERCAEGEPGDRFHLKGVKLRAFLEGEIDGVADAQLEVVDRGASACLAGLSVGAGSVAVRLDLVTGRSDFVRTDVDGGRRDVRCTLSHPSSATR